MFNLYYREHGVIILWKKFRSLWQRNFRLGCAADEQCGFDLYCREKKWRPDPDLARNFDLYSREKMATRPVPKPKN